MENQTDEEIIHRELDTSAEDPATQIVEVISDIEEKGPTELPPMYECVDGILDHLFSNPPAPEATMEIEFTYRSYRVTIDQEGNLKLISIE